jgi:hypothetical protein
VEKRRREGIRKYTTTDFIGTAGHGKPSYDLQERKEKPEFFISGLGLIGFQFEYFTEYEKAVAWLSEEQGLPGAAG